MGANHDYLLEVCIQRREPGFARDSRERRTLQASVSHWDGDPLQMDKRAFDDCVGRIEARGVKVESAKCIAVLKRRGGSAPDAQGNFRSAAGTGAAMEARGEIRAAPAELMEFEYQGCDREAGPDGLLIRWTLRIPAGPWG